jgi:hypothetical protein
MKDSCKGKKGAELSACKRQVKVHKIKDLSMEDVFGEYTYCIEEKHFLGKDHWRVDKEANTESPEPIYFRVLKNGIPQHSHGWIVRSKVMQWG